MNRPRPPINPAFSPMLQRELQAANDMVTAGVEPTLKDAIETCIKYSGEGPFTPREQAILRAHPKK